MCYSRSRTGDGEFFHFDYYNSFVIHPMFVDALAILKQKNGNFASLYATELRRARRYAEIQERLISPDASFPVVGRSVTYRFGAFHALLKLCCCASYQKRSTRDRFAAR